jgi:phosphoribosyl 1,2-cyclic phosphodiesterase
MRGTRIRFWGVRGSIASPGPETAAVGGNTSAVELELDGGTILLDAGTGLRELGRARMRHKRAVEATLLLSHLHWDHIQGLPFFGPLYDPATRLAICGPGAAELGLPETLLAQMSAPVFPVRWTDLPADIEHRTVRAGSRFAAAGARIRCARLNHPGGVMAYRIDHGGRSVVYATDTEPYRCVDPALVRLAEGADVLIHDAQYTPEEYPSRVGWGHSTWEDAVETALAAGVGKLVLFHHDPDRSDAAVEAIERAARARFPETIAAREGLEIELDALPGQAEEAA